MPPTTEDVIVIAAIRRALGPDPDHDALEAMALRLLPSILSTRDAICAAVRYAVANGPAGTLDQIASAVSAFEASEREVDAMLRADEARAQAQLYWCASEGGWLLDRVVDGKPDSPAVYARRTASLATLAKAVRKVDPPLRPGPIAVLDRTGKQYGELVAHPSGEVTWRKV